MDNKYIIKFFKLNSRSFKIMMVSHNYYNTGFSVFITITIIVSSVP